MNWYEKIKIAKVLLPTETLEGPLNVQYEAIRLIDGRIIYDEKVNHWELYYRNSNIIGKITRIESVGYLGGDGVYLSKYVGKAAWIYLSARDKNILSNSKNWYKTSMILLPTETLNVSSHKRFEAIRLIDGRTIYDEYTNHWELYYQNNHIIKRTNIESLGWLSGDGVYEKKYIGQDAWDYLNP